MANSPRKTAPPKKQNTKKVLPVKRYKNIARSKANIKPEVHTNQGVSRVPWEPTSEATGSIAEASPIASRQFNLDVKGWSKSKKDTSVPASPTTSNRQSKLSKEIKAESPPATVSNNKPEPPYCHLDSLEEFIYSSSDELNLIENLLRRPDIRGVQLVYNWKKLEKSKGVYDFSQIRQDLVYLEGLGKKLFIQLQDRFFSPDARNIPKYLQEDLIYKGGLASQGDADSEGGWVAKQWIKPLRERYQNLLNELAKEFDGRVYGVNLPETAVEVEKDKDFSCDSYFLAELENMVHARNVFKKSYVIQYVNFWPCGWSNENNYMSDTFVFAETHKIGLGGPDTIPNKKAHMKNSYPFFHQSKGKIFPIAMAVQEPDLKYNYTKLEFYNFAKNYLNANLLFWTKCIFDKKYPGC